MHILQKARCPLYVFDQIQKWSRKTIQKDKHYFEGRLPTRASVLKTLDEQYNSKGYKPTVHSVGMPSGKTIEIVIHDLDSAIFSLLNDPDLMKEENLLLDLDTPWKQLEHDDDEISDLHTGSLYKEGWKLYCRDKSKDVLCAFMFFIDKTHTDVSGNLNVEGVTFTLSIFNQQTRNTTKAMRQIGYISNQKNLRYSSAEQKSGDYHAILKFVLKKVYEHQAEKGGLAYELLLKNVNHTVCLQMPVLVFIGDNEGLDKLCGRYLNKTNVKHLC